MTLGPQNKAQLLTATRETAAAFLEDIAHIREVLSRKEHDRGEIRRLSNVLRRFLIDNNGDLLRIAAPRIGRIALSVPDNSLVYEAERERPFVFFASGGAEAFGVGIASSVLDTQRNKHFEAREFNTISVPVGTFLSQKVFYLKGTWATRRDVIKYVANVAHGVHSGAPKEEEHFVLATIRRFATYSVENGRVNVNLRATVSSNSSFEYRSDRIDAVFFELLSAAHFLAISHDVHRLEQFIQQELR